MKKILLFAVLAVSLTLALGSCSKDDKNGISIKQKEFVLNYENEAQIEATSTLPVTYTSESVYVAEVSASGLITAGRVGNTSIRVSNGESQTSVSVSVNPRHNLFPEPFKLISFNDSKQKVKQAFGLPSAEVGDGMLFDNYHLNYDYMFVFDGDKVRTMAVVIPTLSLPTNLADFLDERYQIMALDGYTAGFINEKQDMVVATTPSNDYSSMFVMYLQNTPGKSGSRITERDQLLGAINELLSINP